MPSIPFYYLPSSRVLTCATLLTVLWKKSYAPLLLLQPLLVDLVNPQAPADSFQEFYRPAEHLSSSVLLLARLRALRAHSQAVHQVFCPLL